MTVMVLDLQPLLRVLAFAHAAAEPGLAWDALYETFRARAVETGNGEAVPENTVAREQMEEAVHEAFETVSQFRELLGMMAFAQSGDDDDEETDYSPGGYL